jgi:putative transposase
MAKASMALAELVEKGSDADVPQQMIRYLAKQLMDLDVEGLCGADQRP